MTYEEARALAAQHLERDPFPHPDYRWRLPDGREVADGWYFDYAFEPVRPIPAAEQVGFGGAPGFIVVRDDATIRTVSWTEHSDHVDPTR
jgi:hypothetical protein